MLVREESAPRGYNSITPYFTVKDADRLIDFLKAAFGATIIKEERTNDNRVSHVRLRIGGSIIMLNESSDIYRANVSQMHLFVDDADQAHRDALRNGATSLMQPNDRPHGDRMAGILDPCGNIWWLAAARPAD